MHLVDQHIHSIHWSDKKLLVACSGGLDSTVLVHALHNNNIKFAVLHVNYQLRGEDSYLDEQFVIDLCKRLQIPFHTVKCPKELLKGDGINLQNAARDFRRALFRQWTELNTNNRVVLAHHLNDQEETFFLQLFRGSGTFGLRGMKMESEQIIRPFLKLSKNDLQEYAESNHISWREDVSNAETAYLRNLFRNKLLPQLHTEIPMLKESIGLFQEKLDDSLQHETVNSGEWIEQVLQRRFIPTEEWKSVNDVGKLLLLKRLDLQSWTLKRLNELFDLKLSAELNSGEYSFFKGTKGVYIRSKYDPPKSWEYKIEKRKPTAPCNENETLVCSPDINVSELRVRSLQPNDKIRLPGLNGQKKAWDLLKEAGIPSQIRSETPVLTLDNQLIWLPGIAVADSPFTKNNNSSALMILLIEKVK